MSTNKSNHLVNPQAREAMDRFKMEAASQVGVNLTNGYNGELTSRQAGSIGGQMVKKMIEAYENGMKSSFPIEKARRDLPSALFSVPHLDHIDRSGRHLGVGENGIGDLGDLRFGQAVRTGRDCNRAALRG